MARAFEAAFDGDDRARPRGASGFFAWVDGAPADGYRAPRGCGRSAVPEALGRRRAGRRSSRASTAPLVLAPAARPGPERVRAAPGRQRFFGGNIAVTACCRSRRLGRALAQRARRTALPPARRVSVQGRVPRRHDRRRPARRGRGGADRRACSLGRSARPVPLRRSRPPGPSGPRSIADDDARPDRRCRALAGAARRWWSWPGGRTSASRLSSTASSAGGRRGRGAARGDPGPSGARGRVGGRRSRRRHRRLDREGRQLDAKVTAQAERAIAAADLVLLVVDVTVGVTDEDEAVARLLAADGRPVLWWPTRWTTSGARPTPGSRVARARRPVMVSALHGRGSGDLLDEVVRLPASVRTATAGDDRPADGDDRRRRPGAHDGRHQVSRGGDRGPPERRQVDAVQPPDRRGAGRRPRPAGHDPRRDRHGGRDTDGADPVRRHRRHARQVAHRATGPSTSRWCGRSPPSTGPTSPCS